MADGLYIVLGLCSLEVEHGEGPARLTMILFPRSLAESRNTEESTALEQLCAHLENLMLQKLVGTSSSAHMNDEVFSLKLPFMALYETIPI